jgi:hypothetical protein
MSFAIPTFDGPEAPDMDFVALIMLKADTPINDKIRRYVYSPV